MFNLALRCFSSLQTGLRIKQIVERSLRQAAVAALPPWF